MVMHMKKIIIFLLLLSLTLFLGCSTSQKNLQEQRDFSPGRGLEDRGPDNLSREGIQRPFEEGQQIIRPNNMSEEEMKKQFEERQQKAIEACEGKDEGENCIFEDVRGETEGICYMMDNNLVCTIERPMGPRGE